jgi:rSAM/selenodomain-associated transferase 2
MRLVKKRALLGRIACAILTVVALVIVFKRIDSRALAEAFRAMRPGWFVAAIVVYGLLFIPAAWRWHLALRQTKANVHFAASARLTFIGHFLYTILFGAAGGDVAKSAIYARWYRLPLPQVLAAAPLDRFMGSAGLIMFGFLAAALAAFSGGFTQLRDVALSWHRGWLIAAAVLVMLVLLILARSKRETAWVRFSKAFVAGGKQLLTSPRVLFSGVLCGFLVQVGLNSAFAFNLQAVTHAELNWLGLAWTFPVICVISALPITIGGLGVREGAALALLTMYGVPKADAVAASLLTLAAGMLWTVIGGILLWREENRQESNRVLPTTISVVIPTLNEAEALAATVRAARAVPEVSEVIVVDGGSADKTVEIANELGCRVLRTTPSRGKQLRLGAAEAGGEIILMLHADTLLPQDAGTAVVNCFRDATIVGGGFWKIFGEDSHPLMRGSRLRCAIRLYAGGRVAGDQAFFVRRDVLENLGGVPDVPLMEEWELCRRLRKAGRLAMADATVVTSARRFAKLGVLRAYLRMWRVGVRYRLGTSPQELSRAYEKD